MFSFPRYNMRQHLKTHVGKPEVTREMIDMLDEDMKQAFLTNTF